MPFCCFLGQDLHPSTPNELRTARSTLRSACERSLSRGNCTIVNKLLGSRSLRYELQMSSKNYNVPFAVLFIKLSHGDSELDPIDEPSLLGKWETPVFRIDGDSLVEDDDVVQLAQVDSFCNHLLGRVSTNSNVEVSCVNLPSENCKDMDLLTKQTINSVKQRLMSRLPILPGDFIADGGIQISAPTGITITSAHLHYLTNVFWTSISNIPTNNEELNQTVTDYLVFIQNKCQDL
ncbi:hypothetical protein GEMRC1_008399 [Eukaryota sp. GEM-RC1]